MATSIRLDEIKDWEFVNEEVIVWRSGNKKLLYLFEPSDRVDIEGTASNDDINLYGEGVAEPFIEAGDGDDIFEMRGDSRARFYGGSGNDYAIIINNRQNQYLVGDHGDDTLISSDGNDFVIGGEGQDTLIGGGGNDKIGGGNGADWLQGDSGNDYLMGDEGNDQLDGGAGDDTLIGGAGHDWLIGGSGSDTFDQRDQRGSLNYTGIADFSFEEGDKIRVNADSLHGIPFNGTPQVTNYQPGNSVLAVRVTTEDNSFLVWGFDTNTFNSDAAFEIM